MAYIAAQNLVHGGRLYKAGDLISDLPDADKLARWIANGVVAKQGEPAKFEAPEADTSDKRTPNDNEPDGNAPDGTEPAKSEVSEIDAPNDDKPEGDEGVVQGNTRRGRK